MPDTFVIKANAQTIDDALQGSLPVMIWISPSGETPLSEVNKALEAAAQKHQGLLKVLIGDTYASPELKERFNLGKRAVLIGWYNGETVIRRQRPWAADVQSIAEKLTTLVPEATASSIKPEKKEKPMDTKPVNVTDTDFEDEVINYDLPVVVDFWAEWCGPCRMVAPTFEKLAKEYSGKVRVAKVDVDKNPGLAQAFRIMSIPTIMFFKEGKIVGQTAGALPEAALRDAFDQLVALELPAE